MIREEVSGAPERVYLHVNDGDDCWCAYHFEGDGDHKEDRTLVAFVREQAWQPIETAPKDDGPSFLVWCPLQRSGNIYHVFRYADDDRFRVFASGGRLLYETPTHWMKLPDPPSPTGDMA